jgi:hypothetical protein
MLRPVPLLNEVGSADVLDELELDCITVVVTERVLVLPLAITSAMTPPAMAPPMMGSHRLRLLMIWFVSWMGLR